MAEPAQAVDREARAIAPVPFQRRVDADPGAHEYGRDLGGHARRQWIGEGGVDSHRVGEPAVTLPRPHLGNVVAELHLTPQVVMR